MPTYDYKCTVCGYRFEELQRMSDNPLTDCPKCGEHVERLIGAGTGLIFKGSGFYITDYKNSKKTTSDTTVKSEGKTKPVKSAAA